MTWALSLRPRSDQCRDVTRHESSFNSGGLEIASWEFIDSTLQRWDPRLVHVVRFVRRLASCRRRPQNSQPPERKSAKAAAGWTFDPKCSVDRWTSKVQTDPTPRSVHQPSWRLTPIGGGGGRFPARPVSLIAIGDRIFSCVRDTNGILDEFVVL